MAARKKRGYSREFPVHGDTGRRYMLDDIPAGFWEQVRAKAKRDGVSLRALLLRMLQAWLNEDDPVAAMAPPAVPDRVRKLVAELHEEVSDEKRSA